MKKIILLSVVGIALAITSCGKKVTASFTGAMPESAYHNFKKSTSVNTTSTESTVLTNSHQDLVAENQVVESSASASTTTLKVKEMRSNLNNLDKTNLTEKQLKLVNKLDHKLSKLEKKAEKKGKSGGYLKIGLILMLIGILIGVLMTFIFWPLSVIGWLLFLVGACLVIYELIMNM